MTGSDPLVAAEIQQRDDRCRRSGGIGAAVVLIQCGGLSQVMPVEVDAPSKITWDIRDDWEDVLHHFVESGRSDFKPISTTSRGSVSVSSPSSTLISNSTRTHPSACITGDWRPPIVILVGLDETFGTGLSLVDSSILFDFLPLSCYSFSPLSLGWTLPRYLIVFPGALPVAFYAVDHSLYFYPSGSSPFDLVVLNSDNNKAAQHNRALRRLLNQPSRIGDCPATCAVASRFEGLSLDDLLRAWLI